MNLLAPPDPRVITDWLLRTSLQVALLVAVITLVTALAGRRLSPGCRYALWLLVAVRLALPVLPGSAWSAFNFFADKPAHTVVSDPILPAQPEAGWIITRHPLPAPPPRAIENINATHLIQWNWRHLVLLLWSAGVAAFLARIAAANIAFARRIRRATRVDDADLLALHCACQRQMNVRRPVRIIETDAINGPALWGLARPAILLPPGMLQTLSRDDLRFIFLHELAHLKRCDIALDWCLALLQTVHWFNPAVWFALSRLRSERELSRDAMVLALASPRDQRRYGQTILKLVQAISPPRLLRPGAVGIVEQKRQLKRRIAMIARFDRNLSRGRGLAVALSLLIGAVLLTDRRATAAAPTDPATPTPELSEDAAARQRADHDEAQIADWMERRFPAIRFDAAAFEDVVSFLRDVSGQEIFVNWKSLEAIGVHRRTPVTARLKTDTRFSAALDTILQSIAGGGKLDYVVERGVITITTADDLAADTDIQIYDVRDLLEVEEKDERQATIRREALVKELTTLITETIDPPSWKKLGSIRHLSGQLIITATRKNHAQVLRMLDRLREDRAIQISLEVRFITATRDLIEKHKIGLDQGKGVGFMSDEQVAALVRALQRDENSTFLTAPRVTLANGQKGSVKVLQQSPYVAGFNLVNGEFQPQVATHSSGVVFDVVATSSDDRKYVTLDAHPQVTQLLELTEIPWKNAPPGRNDLKVQVPRETKQEAKALVSIPNGGTMAMLLQQALVPDDKQPEQRLLMFVKPTIQVRPPPKQQPFPLINEPKKPQR